MALILQSSKNGMGGKAVVVSHSSFNGKVTARIYTSQGYAKKYVFDGDSSK